MGGSAANKNKIFSQALKQKMPGIASGETLTLTLRSSRAATCTLARSSWVLGE